MSNTTINSNDNSAAISNLKRQISSVSAKIDELEKKIKEIDKGIEKVTECLNRKDENNVIVLNQGYTTFNWLMNNMDKYWTDMEGSVRSECKEFYQKLNDESNGPIAVAKAEASGVLAAAEEKKVELELELESLYDELNSLNAELESLKEE